MKCDYCGRETPVFHASKGKHACTTPACERAFEKDTQFETYGYLHQEVKRTPIDGKAGDPTGESSLPLVPP